MSRYEKCIPRTLSHEGGFVNDPRDAGGATNLGITIATYRRYLNSRGTVADLKAMTRDQAVTIYKRQYWDAVNGDKLPAGLDYAVFDYAVNSGPARAAKALQGLLGVAQDGALGPATLAAIGGRDVAALINGLCDQRLAFMRSIRGGKDWRAFSKGWTRRVEDVRSAALADVGAPVAAPTPEPTPARQNWLASIIIAIFGGRA